ncbi:MAG TPA: hypothetical protein VGH28_25775 [Polyangiaceae bacterium]|jgi:hypothetical protein
MLSREVMGVLCLGVVWMTALLVAAAAWQELRDLRALAKRAKRASVGTVVGDDLAEWRALQTGRATDREEIAFHDRKFESEVFGGRVDVDGETIEIARSDAEVWTDERARREAAECSDAKTFDAAYAQARKAKGFARDVRVRVRPGDRVWIVGKEIVSTIDPVAFCNKKSLAFVLFIPLELAVCAAATRLALATPHFGKTSIAGAIVCLAFFLGVTPLGVALREGARRPSRAFLRNTWSRRALASGPAAAVPQKN